MSNLTTALEISLTGSDLQYDVDLVDAAPHQILFFEKTLALLEGRIIFKRLGSASSLNRDSFNPLKQTDPKKAGYGLRQLRLSQDLAYFEISMVDSNRVEQRIKTSELFRVVVAE